MKKQRTFYIDLVLAAICLLTLITGLIIHAAGHGIVQSNVKIWRVAHIVWGVLFLILSTGHIRAHRGWYKSLPERFRQRSKVTVCLSAVYLLTSATDLILILHRENAGTHLGILHYQAGILFGILAIWHLCGRMKILLTMRNFPLSASHHKAERGKNIFICKD